MVNVPNGANVQMRFASIKFLLVGHSVLLKTFYTIKKPNPISVVLGIVAHVAVAWHTVTNQIYRTATFPELAMIFSWTFLGTSSYETVPCNT